MADQLVFDIKRFAINDGPGIRMVIFFKGCPLSCTWCHNPESMSPRVQKLYTKSKCIGALKCIEICPYNALTISKNGIVTNSEICNLCGKCVEVCPTKAMELSGTVKSINELLFEIEKERLFFEQSGGGVTFSGGEPMLNAKFLLKILKECKQRRIHRAVDTSAYSSLTSLLKMAKYTNLFLIDLKVMDDAKHKFYTGVSNQKILKNIIELAKTDIDILFRIPLIKGVNLDDKNIIETARFMNSLAGNRNIINLLPFHSTAITKHEKMGKSISLAGMEKPSEIEIAKVVKLFEEHQIIATIGG
jgi:pyruvate formate lyase activating enzyme